MKNNKITTKVQSLIVDYKQSYTGVDKTDAKFLSNRLHLPYPDSLTKHVVYARLLLHFPVLYDITQAMTISTEVVKQRTRVILRFE